ncbi:hypothetical protein MMPV_002751 [Pyropia vietnamensis]
MSALDAVTPSADAAAAGDSDPWTVTSTMRSPEAPSVATAGDTQVSQDALGASVVRDAATAAGGWSFSSTVRLSSGVCVEPTMPPPVASTAAAGAGAAVEAGVAKNKSSKGFFFRRASKDVSSPRRSRRLSKEASAGKGHNDAENPEGGSGGVAGDPAVDPSSLSANNSTGESAADSDHTAGTAEGAVPSPPTKPSRKSLSEAVAPHAKADAASVSDAVDNVGALLDTAVTASATACRQLPALDPAGVHAAYMSIAKYLTTASTVQRGFPVTALLLAASERSLRAVDALQSLRLLAYRRRLERAAAKGGVELTVAAEATSGDKDTAAPVRQEAEVPSAVEEDADLRVLTADYAMVVRGALDRVVSLFPNKEDSFLGRWQKRGAVFISPSTKAAMFAAARELDASRLAVREPLAAVCGAYDAPDVEKSGRMLSPNAEERFS